MANQATRSLDAGAIALMLVLCTSWGLQQAAVKLALPEVPPLFQGGLRSAIAAAVVLAWGLGRGWPVLARNRSMTAGLASGLLFGMEFLFLYLALQWTDSARAVLFLYTSPFWVALGARLLLPGETLRARQWWGMGLAFAGVGMAMFGASSSGVKHPASVAGAALDWRFVGDCLALLAGICWGATTLVIKATRLKASHFSQILLYQLGVSGMLLLLASLVAGENWHHPVWEFWSRTTWLSMIYQTFWVASITFLLWFNLIARYSVSHLSSMTFLTPLVGIAVGAALLGEQLTAIMVLASCCVVLGLVIINWPASPASRR